MWTDGWTLESHFSRSSRFLFLFVWDRISLCNSPGYPITCFVGQAVLKESCPSMPSECWGYISSTGFLSNIYNFMIYFLETFLRKTMEIKSHNLLTPPPFCVMVLKIWGHLDRVICLLSKTTLWYYCLHTVKKALLLHGTVISLKTFCWIWSPFRTRGCGGCAATGKVRVCLVTGLQFFCV